MMTRHLEELAGRACDASSDGTEYAVVTVAKGEQSLQFCGHHFNQHEASLIALEWVVTSDLRPKVLEEVS